MNQTKQRHLSMDTLIHYLILMSIYLHCVSIQCTRKFIPWLIESYCIFIPLCGLWGLHGLLEIELESPNARQMCSLLYYPAPNLDHVRQVFNIGFTFNLFPSLFLSLSLYFSTPSYSSAYSWLWTQGSFWAE